MANNQRIEDLEKRIEWLELMYRVFSDVTESQEYYQNEIYAAEAELAKLED